MLIRGGGACEGGAATIEVRYEDLPPDVVVEVRTWPTPAEAMACGLCPAGSCTATLAEGGVAVCVVTRPADDDNGDDDGDGAGEPISPGCRPAASPFA